MALNYKFKSAKDYDSVVFDGHFISVRDLKRKIFEIKYRFGMAADYDLIITNAQTNEEYLDGEMWIPKNTSVLVQRIPGLPMKPIVVEPVPDQEKSIVENNSDDNVQALKDGFTGSATSVVAFDDDLDWHEFGNDPFAIPEPENTPLISKEGEDNLIKALIDTPALDWQRQPSEGFGPGRGFRRGMTGRNTGRCGFGRVGFEKKTPPEGYICHRCKVPGHLIQHCPTNGDPTFDIKRVKPPTGIPKSMLVASPDGSYALPSGAVAVMKPNEAETEGMPSSTRSVCVLPPELHCPLCKEVMKDSVLTSKCCFTSFCDGCIRDHTISKSMCVCGATNIVADDLLPNKTLRDTINRILKSNNSSDEYGGRRSRSFQVQDMESYNPQAKVPSPIQSAASKGQNVAAQPSQREESSKISEHVSEEKGRTLNVPDAPEATHDSRVKEAASQNSALVEQEVQQIPISGEAGEKKIKKKVCMIPDDAKSPCRIGQDLAPENCMMMAMGPAAFGPHWNSMQQPGFDGFMPPLYPGQMPPYYTGYGLSPMDIAFRGMLAPQGPFGAIGPMMPYGVPFHMQRDLPELATGLNAETAVMGREQFEARKSDLKRKRERVLSRDWDNGKQISSAVDVSPEKSKYKSIPGSNSEHQHHQSETHSPEHRSCDQELPRASSKKKSDLDYTHQDNIRHHSRDHHEDDRHKHRGSSSKGRPESQPDYKPSVFLRVTFPDKKSARKRKKLLASEFVTVSNGFHEEHRAMTESRSSRAVTNHDNSDDKRDFRGGCSGTCHRLN